MEIIAKLFLMRFAIHLYVLFDDIDPGEENREGEAEKSRSIQLRALSR